MDGGAPQDAGPALDGGAAQDGGADAGTLAGFGAACVTGRDCQSGICIDVSSGGICSKPCSQDCPTDWGCRVVNLTPVCVPPELAQCSDCTTDADCGGLFKCTRFGGANVCLKACASNGACGATERCVATATDADGGVGLTDAGVSADAGLAGRCVPHSDTRNCGACGNRCGTETGTACCNGQCVNLLTSEGLCGTTCEAARACTGGEQCCGGACTDVSTSSTHCGACLSEGGATCQGADARCCGGGCVTTRDNAAHCGSCSSCSMGQACCGTQCADRATDPNHCNGCGLTCQSAQACCGTSGCQTLTANDQHCGACNQNCATAFGAAGKCCGSGCVNKLTNAAACGDSCTACTGVSPACCNGTCADFASTATCRACNVQCTAGQACCATGCKSLQTDALNCGTCGNACGAGQTCCAGQCKTTTTDTDHCGACDRRCGRDATLPNVATYTCATSNCFKQTCVSGFFDCDGTGGCETVIPTNTSCQAAVNLGNIADAAGSDPIEVTQTAQAIIPGQSRWYKAHPSDPPFDDWKVFAKVINLSAGLNVDLFAYRRAPGKTCTSDPAVTPATSGACTTNISGCGGSQQNSNRCSQNSGGASECVGWVESCSAFLEDDETEVWIEVRNMGTTCGTFDLKVRGNGNNDGSVSSFTCTNFLAMP